MLIHTSHPRAFEPEHQWRAYVEPNGVLYCFEEESSGFDHTRFLSMPGRNEFIRKIADGQTVLWVLLMSEERESTQGNERGLS